MRELRAQFDVGPVAIHASYLINVCSQTETVRTNSVAAFRARWSAPWPSMLSSCAPSGSWKGLTARRACASPQGPSKARSPESTRRQGLPNPHREHRRRGVLPWRQAGAGRRAGGAPLPLRAGRRLPRHMPHPRRRLRHRLRRGLRRHHAAGRRDAGLRHGEGLALQRRQGPFASRLDRHQHIGEGTIGAAPFRRLLHDARFAHCAFIAETPVDAPRRGRNVATLKALRRSKLNCACI